MIFRNQRGSALLETALVSMVLIMITAGIVDVGRAFGTYMAITNAAREGARAGARLPCDVGTGATVNQAIIDATVREATGSDMTLGAGNVVIIPDPISACPFTAGSTIEVQVSYNFATIFGSILGLNPIPISNTVKMVYFGNDYE